MSDTIAELKAEIERLKMDLSSYAARDTDGMNDAVGMGMEIERLQRAIQKSDREWYAKLEAADAEIERLREALEWIAGACGDVNRCKCGRPTGIPALKSHAERALRGESDDE